MKSTLVAIDACAGPILKVCSVESAEKDSTTSLYANVSKTGWVCFQLHIFKLLINFQPRETAGLSVHRNKPYSYSHGWTGTSIQWRLVRGISFEFEKIPPHEPLLHVSASPTVRIRISSIQRNSEFCGCV